MSAFPSQLKNGYDMNIASYSRILNQTKQNKNEAFAVKSALRRFRFYMLGYEVHMYSESLPLVYIFKT